MIVDEKDAETCRRGLRLGSSRLLSRLELRGLHRQQKRGAAIGPFAFGNERRAMGLGERLGNREAES
jgi:hypothetical protein